MADIERSKLPWYPVGNGFVAHAGRTRGKKGRIRFLLLAPPKPGVALRATAAAGDIVDGRCVVDHGVLGPEQRDAIETLWAAGAIE